MQGRPSHPSRSLPSAIGSLIELRASWPPRQPPEARGYSPTLLEEMRPVDALKLAAIDGSRDAVVVVAARADGSHVALPLIRAVAGWHVAAAGEGAAAALVDRLGSLDEARDATLDSGFRLTRETDRAERPGPERQLGHDQSNHSVVVAEAAIVKWRTAPGAGGLRSVTLRRHLAANGFEGGAPLLAVLTWQPADGSEVALADVDAFLPGAVDGWELAIRALLMQLSEGTDDVAFAARLGGELGRLMATMHIALARPSSVLGGPRSDADAAQVASWRVQAQQTLAAASQLDAPDAALILKRVPALASAIDTMAGIESTTTMPTHGDLHLGQVVGWDHGLALIDFDGPPGMDASEADHRQPAARDVAQMLCSLEHLAVVVDRRSAGRSTEALRHWARDASSDLLRAYRAGLTHEGLDALFDARLLPAFMAEQSCRELLYAAQMLPRWRYAPLGAIEWRYPAGTA